MAKATTQAAQPKLAFPIQVVLTQPQADLIKAADPENQLPATLTTLAQSHVDEFLSGGFLVKAGQVRDLNNATDTQILDGEALVKVVQDGFNRIDGGRTFRFTIDETFVGPLEDLSNGQGRSIEDIIQDCMYEVLVNGWCYSLEIDGKHFSLSSEVIGKIEDVYGVTIETGDDIAKILLHKQGSAK